MDSTRAQEIIDLARELARKQKELVALLGAEKKTPIKPEHRKGTVCDAPRDEHVPTEGVFIYRDDEKQAPKAGDYALGECGNSKDTIFKAAYEFWPGNTRYILTHVMPKPEPKFKEGQWVTCPGGRPFQWTHYDEVHRTSLYRGFRLAKPIDFAVEFKGVKVWMEKHNGYVYEYRYGTGYDGNGSRLNPWEIERNEAAGIPTVPEEVCNGNK